MKKQILVVATAALMTMASVVPALADDIVVTGGSRTLVPAPITLPVTLTGLDQVDLLSDSTGEWTVTDATGSGDGYHYTVVATVPTNGEHTIPLAGFEMTVPALTTDAGNTAPASLFTAKALTTEAQVLINAAAGTGMGTYTFVPTFTLDVPAETYAGTYVTTITLTEVVGPAAL